ncbi:MAG: hypothetical protein M5U28_15710 [Sandaracinaceae bacterium]|nr:hypothetical protein [Sandaracinaceae bacterium]
MGGIGGDAEQALDLLVVRTELGVPEGPAQREVGTREEALGVEVDLSVSERGAAVEHGAPADVAAAPGVSDLREAAAVVARIGRLAREHDVGEAGAGVDERAALDHEHVEASVHQGVRRDGAARAAADDAHVEGAALDPGRRRRAVVETAGLARHLPGHSSAAVGRRGFSVDRAQKPRCERGRS